MTIPRRSPKQAVMNFISPVLIKIERGETVHENIIIQLQVYKDLAKEMDWELMHKRISAAIETHNQRTGNG